jgi:ketosteroid isomerase-like protein
MRHDLPATVREGAMSEAANVAMLQESYRRWHESRGGSVDHWMTICAENINFGSLAEAPPTMAFAKTYSNREAMRGYFDGLLADWEMIHYTVGEFVAQGDAVFMRGSTAWRNKRTGQTVDTPKVDFWRFRDGKAVEFYEYFDTARVIAAATG